MNRIFKTQRTLTFREADPAQIMFFGNIFGWAHDTFELFIQDAGIPWKEYFQLQDYFIPIRHTSADFLAPFFPGKTYEVEACIEKISQSSFTMKYTFSSSQNICAKVVMIHTFVDPKTKEKTSIPEKFLQKMTPYLLPQNQETT